MGYGHGSSQHRRQTIDRINRNRLPIGRDAHPCATLQSPREGGMRPGPGAAISAPAGPRVLEGRQLETPRGEHSLRVTKSPPLTLRPLLAAGRLGPHPPTAGLGADEFELVLGHRAFCNGAVGMPLHVRLLVFNFDLVDCGAGHGFPRHLRPAWEFAERRTLRRSERPWGAQFRQWRRVPVTSVGPREAAIARAGGRSGGIGAGLCRDGVVTAHTSARKDRNRRKSGLHAVLRWSRVSGHLSRHSTSSRTISDPATIQLWLTSRPRSSYHRVTSRPPDT